MSTLTPDGIAVVTGASSGIGASYADRLAAHGYPLLLVSRRQDRLDELAAALRSRHEAEVETMVADLQRADDLGRLEQRLVDEQIAILVNNAGAGGLGPTAQSTAHEIEALIRLNVVALSRLSHAALAGFRRRGAGALVNIGSIIAFAPPAGGAVYGGTKAYVLNFTRSLQQEYAKSGIRIQVVMPGPVRTEFFSSQGVSDSVFPDSSFLGADEVVDAALAGLEAGEKVTHPSMVDLDAWHALEAARGQYLQATMSGTVAPRYQNAAPVD
jgi:hypothetical protein